MEKEPIKSWSVSEGTRVKYYDVHRDRQGQLFMVITEIPKNGAKGNKKRQKIFLHREYIEQNLMAMTSAANYILGVMDKK